MSAYYNENDPAAAAWLRNLVAADLIAPGVVDERSIVEVTAGDLKGFVQCHFFAGIGGWSYALRLADWPDNRPVWTGSCPCQPFSVAGQGKAEQDERHLWPEFYRLICECKPAVVLGEQVASKAGRAWLAGVRADLEALDYGVGAADLCAAGVGAPHIRQRLWWVADAAPYGARSLGRDASKAAQEPAGEAREKFDTAVLGERSAPGGVADASAERHERSAGVRREAGAGAKHSGGLGHADNARSQRRGVLPERTDERSAWAASLDSWIPCGDGKARRLEPGIEPLAHGVPGRVVKLRGYGNAIVPQIAETFIRAYADLCASV